MPLLQKHGAHGFGARQAIGHIVLMLPDGAAELLKSQIVVIKFKQSVKPIHTHHPLPVISFGVILRQCLHGHDGSPAKVSLKVASNADSVGTWKPTNASLVLALSIQSS